MRIQIQFRLKKAERDGIASFARAANVKQAGAFARAAFFRRKPSAHEKARRLKPAGLNVVAMPRANGVLSI
jgi:hypothetical protein